MVATPARNAPTQGQKRAPKPRLARSVVWLASYPKSGNTWLRIFLVNYLFGRETPADINDIARIGIADNATDLYRKLNGGPFDPADTALALRLRERLMTALGTSGSDLNLVKTHCGNFTISGTRLCPPGVTKGAVLIVRDPRDVCLSYARHFGLSLARAAASMAEPGNSTSGGEKFVKQYLGSWSDHALSWSREAGFPVLTLRYEDMLADPEAEFGRVVTHLGLPLDAHRVARAARFSAFEEVQRQEERTPFAERSDKAGRFFHSGRAGLWREALPEPEQRVITEANAEAMQRHGYL